MKKFLILMLSAILIVFCAGCGTFTPPIVSESNNGSGTGQEKPGDNTGDDDNPGLTGNEFSVTLRVLKDGKSLSSSEPIESITTPFYVLESDDVKAVWKGQGETHSVKFSSNGVAVTRGLDGSYEVSLIGLPEGYTYDPNGNYNVNNYKRDIIIPLMELSPAFGAGTGFSNSEDGDLSIRLQKTGNYRAVLTKTGQKIYYTFMPSTPGKYSIQSWVSVQENEINPKMEAYTNANEGGYVNPTEHTQYNDGGKCGTFTKNFKFELDRGSGQTGLWGFRISADVKPEHSYPVYVDFTILYEGASSLGTTTKVPKGRFNESKQLENNGQNWHYIYEGEPSNLLDGSKVRLNWTDKNNNGIWDEDDDGDGYYHVVLPDAIGADGNVNWSQCPTLYVALFCASTLLSNGFTNEFPITVGDELTTGADVYDANWKSTYQKYCVNGYHPVNPELKTFLEDYSQNNGGRNPWFNDGKGMAENSPYSLTSGPDGVWLYACGYFSNTLYVKNSQ